MIEKILQWCGIVFAVAGVVCLFLEAIGSIRKHNNTKLSILSLVFLTISLVGYIVTEIVLRSKGLPSFFSVVWVVFLWAYLICNLVSYLKINKKNRALKREQKLTAEKIADTEIAELTNSEEQFATEQTVAADDLEQIEPLDIKNKSDENKK